jgi:DUF1009 family protein
MTHSTLTKRVENLLGITEEEIREATWEEIESRIKTARKIDRLAVGKSHPVMP